jgi:hypothetical protein
VSTFYRAVEPAYDAAGVEPDWSAFKATVNAAVLTTGGCSDETAVLSTVGPSIPSACQRAYSCAVDATVG